MIESPDPPVSGAWSDEQQVLRHWGDLSTDPMNGETGRALAQHVIAAVAAIQGVSRVCDLGCGNGHLAACLANRGYSVFAVDASERLLSLARQHHASDRIEYCHALIGPALVDRAAEQRRFDLVVSVEVVEHLYRPMTLIETADALLRPGGHLVVSTPYHGYLKNLAIALLGRWDAHHGVHWDGGHIKFFSVPTLRTLVSSRFDVQRFEYFGRVRGLWKNMICIATKTAS